MKSRFITHVITSAIFIAALNAKVATPFVVKIATRLRKKSDVKIKFDRYGTAKLSDFLKFFS